MVKINFLFVKEVVDILGKEVLKEWLMIVEKMYIFFDSENSYYLEYEGYILDKEVK